MNYVPSEATLKGLSLAKFVNLAISKVHYYPGWWIDRLSFEFNDGSVGPTDFGNEKYASPYGD